MSTHNAPTNSHTSPTTPAAKAVALVRYCFVWIPLYILFAATVVMGGIAILAVLPLSAAKGFRRTKPASRTEDHLDHLDPRPRRETLATSK